jgi:hypothetical protein
MLVGVLQVRRVGGSPYPSHPSHHTVSDTNSQW